MSIRARRMVAVGMLVAGLGACGGNGDRQVRESEGSTRGLDAPSNRRVVLPDVEVRNVATGEHRSLATLLPSDRPLLVWFWAPH